MTALLDWVSSHTSLLARTVSEHITLSLAALAAVIVIAVPLAILLSRRPHLAGPAMGGVNVLRTIPSLALLVLMLPLIGTGFWPSVLALVVYGLPAVLLNTLTGVTGVDRDIVEAARGQGLSGGQMLRQVELPLASPVIVGGIRTAAVQIVSAATLAVFIGGGGLGELISAGMGLLDIPQLVAGSLAVAALAAATEIAFWAAEHGLARRFGVEAGA